MVKSFQLSFGIFLIVMLAGCATKGVVVKDVTVKGYMQDRERVDQDANGNSGYLKGTAPAPGPTKKTRKVYVVEVTKNPKIEDTKAAAQPQAASPQNNVMEESKQESQKAPTVPEHISLPKFGDESELKKNVASVEQQKSPNGITEYTVEKDDTLQKISKKFYGSFSKWPKIYEANKDVIKDPNHIPSGIKIKIPPVL